MSGTGQNVEAAFDARPKPYVFVLMPFDRAFTDVYQLGIRPACEKAGAYAERLDDQIFTESMLQRIYTQIAKADVIVADMTGRNPNVFYEVGYAHALGKVVILLTRDREDIPFDLKHYRHIVYENVTSLIPQLETSVEWATQQSIGRRQPKEPITIWCGTESLRQRPVIERVLSPETIKHGYGTFALRLTLENSDRLHRTDFDLALWMSGQDVTTIRWGDRECKPKRHPDGRRFFDLDVSISLMPEQFIECGGLFTLDKQFLDSMVNGPKAIHPVMQVLTDSGSYNYPFSVMVKLR